MNRWRAPLCRLSLALIEHPLETYLNAGDLGRRLLNQVFFTEIRVGEHSEVREATIVPAYARVIAPRLIRRHSHAHEAAQRRANPDPLALGSGFDRDKNGAPGEIRTPDLRFRRPTLYPAELLAQGPPV